MDAKRPSAAIPTSYVARLLELLESRCVRVEEVLRAAGVTRAEIGDPSGRIGMDRVLVLIERSAAAADDPGLGLALGFAITPLSHGLLGVAMMSCGSLREALDLVDRFLKVRAYPVPVHIFVDGEVVVIQFDDDLPRGPARQVVIEAVLAASLRIATFLLGFSLQHPDVEFRADFAEPPHHARFRDQLPRMRYGCPRNEGRFPVAWLDRRLCFDDPVSKREAVGALEPARELLPDDWLTRTRAVLADPAAGFPVLEELAVRLGTSARSLRRYLHDQGVKYQHLRDEARRARAVALVEHSALSVDDIALDLGYSGAAAFGRAFQRWTGTTPHAARGATAS